MMLKTTAVVRPTARSHTVAGAGPPRMRRRTCIQNGHNRDRASRDKCPGCVPTVFNMPMAPFQRRSLMALIEAMYYVATTMPPKVAGTMCGSMRCTLRDRLSGLRASKFGFCQPALPLPSVAPAEDP